MPSAKVADGNCRHITAALQCEKIDNDTQKAERQLYKRLAQRRDVLEDQLLRKLEQLKATCIREGELTGELPPEIYKTLLPGEMEPKVKRRVGTTFKFSEQFLTRTPQPAAGGNANDEDATTQLEADIELHRKIVAAAERLAKDKNTNKSVRKKRRKDWQAATQRLKGLEKGLYKLRISSSKPDVSANFDTMSCGNIGSGFSLNSLKGWPNISGHSLKSPAKSCPSTPHGSLRDLSSSELAIFKADTCSDAPSTSADARSTTALNSVGLSNGSGLPPKRSSKSKLLSALSPRPSTSPPKSTAQCASSMALSAQLPPAIPNRRHQPPATSVSSTSLNHAGHDAADDGRLPYYEPPLYANIGYASAAPYKSAYRQSNFPTFQDSINVANGNKMPSFSTRFSTERNADLDGSYVIEYPPPPLSLQQQQHGTTDLSASGLASQFAKFTRHISATTSSSSMSSCSATSSTNQPAATAGGHQHHPTQQSQRCSTSSQSSSISIGSISSTSSSSGYNSLANGASTQQLFVGSVTTQQQQHQQFTCGDDAFPCANSHSRMPNAPKLSSSSACYAYPNSTTSLDRRAMRGGFSSTSLLAASIYDNFHQNTLETRFQTQNNLLTTTFPVNDCCRPRELNDFSKFRSNSSVTPQSNHADPATAATMKRASVSAREFPRFHSLASNAQNSFSNFTCFQSYKPIRE